MGKTRRGGSQWREGVDTCVFKPAVKCEGDAERPRGVSRIRNQREAGRDVYVEQQIHDYFNHLVQQNVVSVYARSCVPEYEVEDTYYDVPGDRQSDGCDKLGDIDPGPNPDHLNLVTAEWGGELYDYFYPDGVKNLQRLQGWRRAIRGATYAAVELVPDEGPWIVHTDCHLGNILYKVGNGIIRTAIGDWGRTLIIDDPTHIASVREGIREWVKSIEYLQVGPGGTNDEVIAGLDRIENLPQHPTPILNAVKALMQDPVVDFDAHMSKIRGWMVNVIIKQCIDRLPDTSNDVVFERLPLGRRSPSVEALLSAPNQAELRRLRREILLLPPRVAPAAAPAPVPVPLPPVAPLGGPFVAPPFVLPAPAVPRRAGGMYWPAKYSKGLTRKQNLQRKRSATRRTKMSFKNPKAYVPFKSDKGAKTRRSSYTSKFHAKYPDAKTLPEIAKATGISKAVLEKVYNRGMAAWRTGHRPGASQHAWGMARVHSFAMKGKTYRTADADLA